VATRLDSLSFTDVSINKKKFTDVACFVWQLARMYSELPRSTLAGGPAFHLIESSSEHVFVRKDDARMLAGMARNAVHEFVTLANSSGPMWFPVAGGSLETLNRMAYLQAFPGQNSALGLKMEATRANAVVMLDSKTVVEFLMNAVSGMLNLDR
jgi:hypothetical protein